MSWGICGIVLFSEVLPFLPLPTTSCERTECSRSYQPWAFQDKFGCSECTFSMSIQLTAAFGTPLCGDAMRQHFLDSVQGWLSICANQKLFVIHRIDTFICSGLKRTQSLLCSAMVCVAVRYDEGRHEPGLNLARLVLRLVDSKACNLVIRCFLCCVVIQLLSPMKKLFASRRLRELCSMRRSPSAFSSIAFWHLLRQQTRTSSCHVRDMLLPHCDSPPGPRHDTDRMTHSRCGTNE